jgi:hypothetical protein
VEVMGLFNWFCKKKAKGDEMDILKNLGELLASVTILQQQIGELNEQLINAEASLEKSAKDNFDRGVASVVCDTSKVYSEDELLVKLETASQEAVAKFKEQLKIKIEEILSL